jgi:replicative superfamily II helicase
MTNSLVTERRQVEQTQAMIRIVGLSATLPNYRDVAHFLRVNPTTGLFYFDSSYRPVPMSQEFIGVKSKDPMKAKSQMADVCFDRIKSSLQRGYQCMVFVHGRKDTVSTARQLLDIARNRGLMGSCVECGCDCASLSFFGELTIHLVRFGRSILTEGEGRTQRAVYLFR